MVRDVHTVNFGDILNEAHLLFIKVERVDAPYLVVALDPYVRESSVQHSRNEVVADTFHLSFTGQ